MKSAVFYGKHDLRIEDTQRPSITKKQVLIKVMACGVCGTDVHIYEGNKGDTEIKTPIILGHELSGEIVEIGDEVKNFKVGDRVCIDPNHYCGCCEFCKTGNNNFCKDLTVYGSNYNGGYAEFCAVEESQLYMLGDNTSYEQGAMVEPVSCCLHGIDLCDIKAGHQVVIIGGGMMGMIMLQLVKSSGATKIALVEPSEIKREIAKNLGADICIDPMTENVKDVLNKANITWVNTVIECVGLPQTIKQAIDIAGKKATVLMYGLTKEDATVDIKPFEFFEKELTLKSAFINPYTQKRALDLIDSNKIDVSSMICEVASLDKLEEILKRPELRAKGKYIIAPYK